ncbi:MAG: HAMP domain-containing protein [Betaproteobacteria bacterium]|nr:HAMP domain-containing protein [Betaproteobacteria bacterium]
MNSLRQKITFGYAAIGAIVVALSVLSFLELRLLGEKIVAGERIGEFFGLTLEVRRFEKNYFLYHQATDLAENRAYLAEAATLLRDRLAPFEALEDPSRIARLREELTRYAALMEEYSRDADDPALEGRIRQSGKEIVTVAERLSRTERVMLQAMLDRHRQLLIASVVMVAVLVVVIGQLLSRRVSRPLKELEDSMEAVAAGRLAKLEMAAHDREIVSLTQAFNRVLQDLEVRQGQLLRSEKLAALGTLLSGVAHELNNPLSNISSSCEILADEIDGHDIAFKKELLGQILDETWRARRIVRSLLDYARDREFRREDVALARLVDDTLRLVKGQIPAQVSVERRVPDDLVVSGDRPRLQQVLFNLLANAVEAVEGAGEIVISARRTREPCDCRALVFGQCTGQGEAVEIAVRDNGHGIAPDILPRIFDPFFTTRDVGKGLGLGLFIVFEIVEEHGGCIAVDSEPGRGTSFLIRIPAKDSNG